VKLKEGQLRALAIKAKEIIGSPDKWTKDDIKELGNIVGGLLPSELKQIGDQVIKDSLQFLKDVDFKIDQVKRDGCSDITQRTIYDSEFKKTYVMKAFKGKLHDCDHCTTPMVIKIKIKKLF